MRIYLECIPCFLRQAVKAAELSGLQDKKIERVIKGILKKMVSFPFSASPPEMGKFIYDAFRSLSPVKDPYEKIKIRSAVEALRFYKKAKLKIEKAEDSLKAALMMAIAANIIDFGIRHLDIKKEIKRIINIKLSFKRKKGRLFKYSAFKKALKKARDILIIGDNAGETVFDRILIEEIKKEYPEKRIIYAVKGKPIINDALIEDAKMAGIGASARIVSSGCSAPGTLIRDCSKKFKNFFKSADLIISKGQGNFEALSGEKRNIFFLFVGKCEVVAKVVGCDIGDFLLIQQEKNGNKNTV